MAQRKAVTIARGGRRLARGHLLGVEKVTPTRGRVGDDPGRARGRQVREDIPLGTRVHGVVTQHESVEGALPRFEETEVLLKGRAVVGAHHQVANPALLFQALSRLDQARAGRLVPVAQQQHVEVVDPCPAQGEFDRRRHQGGHARVGLHGQHHALAVSARHVLDGTTKGGAPNRAPVEVVDSLLDGLFDEIRRPGKAAADAQPGDLEPRLAERNPVAKVGHGKFLRCAFWRVSRPDFVHLTRNGARALPPHPI